MPNPGRPKPSKTSDAMEAQRGVLRGVVKARMPRKTWAENLFAWGFAPAGESVRSWQNRLTGALSGEWEIPLWVWLGAVRSATVEQAATMLQELVDELDLPLTVSVDSYDPDDLDRLDLTHEHSEIAHGSVDALQAHVAGRDTADDLNALSERIQRLEAAQRRAVPAKRAA